MNNSFYKINRAKILLGISMLMGLSACSSVDNALDTTTAVNYSNNQSVAVLKSPEGLVSPEYDMSFALPEGGPANSQASAVDIRPPDLVK